MKGPRIVKKKSIDTEKDPYLLRIGPDEAATCKKCGSVYHEKRWTHAEKLPESLVSKPKTSVLCPACQKIRDRFPEGFVTLHGDFLREHKEEILNLIRNKEERAAYSNPLGRIIEIKDREGSIEITTTTDKFAQRIGQILNKAFDGTVEYKWSSDVKLTRVVWTR